MSARMILIPNKRAYKTDLKKPLTHYVQKQQNKKKTLAEKMAKLNIFGGGEKVDETTRSLSGAFASMHDLRKEVGAAADAISEPTLVRYHTLVKYLAQLHFLQGRFPITPDAIRIDFGWYDAFSPEVCVKIPVLVWEKVSVLWNMAATQNNIACFLDVSVNAKAAAAHFGLAAGIFQHIKRLSNEFKEERTRDISPELLDLMVQLCTANQQFAIYEGAKGRGMKDETLARLALATSQTFQKCFQMASRTHARTSWTNILAISANHLQAAAHYHMSIVEHAQSEATNRNWGVEVGRLKCAESFIVRALSQHNGLERQVKSRAAALNQLFTVISQERQQKERRNRKIYFDKEPEAHQLPPINPLEMVQINPFDPADEMKDAVDYFADFVPRVVSEAVTEFESKVQAIVNEAKADGQSATDTIRAHMASLGLPASLQANNNEAGLPASVWADIADVQSKGGGQTLEQGLRANQDMNRELMVVLDRASAELSADASEELRRQTQYGSAWTRTTDTRTVGTLRGEITNYRSLLEDAARSDNQVRALLLQHQDDIAQLGCSREQLDSVMPKVDDIHSVFSGERRAVEDLVVESSSLKAEIEKSGQKIEEVAATLDAKGPLLRSSAKKLSEEGNHEIDGKEALLDSVMTPLTELTTAHAATIAKVEVLLANLTSTNAAFTSKQNDNPVLKRRGDVLRGLQQGVSAFRNIDDSVNQGKTFYDQFRDRARQLSSRIQDYRRMRDLEARQHIASINRQKAAPAAPAAAPAPAPAPPPTYRPPPASNGPPRTFGGLPPAPAPAPAVVRQQGPFVGGARAVALPGFNQGGPRLTGQPVARNPTMVGGRAVVAQPVRAQAVRPVVHAPVRPVVRAAPVRAQPAHVVQAAPAGASGKWTCKMCTFENSKPEGLVCEMCSSQRS